MIYYWLEYVDENGDLMYQGPFPSKEERKKQCRRREGKAHNK